MFGTSGAHSIAGFLDNVQGWAHRRGICISQLSLSRSLTDLGNIAHVSSKNAFSSCTNGAIYMQPASAASTACSIVKRVVAKVLIPMLLNWRQAWRPSQVETTLTQSLDMSKLGSNRRQRLTIPISRYQHVFQIPSKGETRKRTFGIFDDCWCRFEKWI